MYMASSTVNPLGAFVQKNALANTRDKEYVLVMKVL